MVLYSKYELSVKCERVHPQLNALISFVKVVLSLQDPNGLFRTTRSATDGSLAGSYFAINILSLIPVTDRATTNGDKRGKPPPSTWEAGGFLQVDEDTRSDITSAQERVKHAVSLGVSRQSPFFKFCARSENAMEHFYAIWLVNYFDLWSSTGMTRDACADYVVSLMHSDGSFSLLAGSPIPGSLSMTLAAIKSLSTVCSFYMTDCLSVCL